MKEIFPPDFLELVVERAGEFLPKEDTLIIKFLLLRSLWNGAEADVFDQFRSLNIPAEVFSGWENAIPHHETGTFIDDNVEEDIVRPQRYTINAAP